MARHIANWLYFSVYTSQEEIDLMLRGRLAKARMQLLTFRVILLIVSMVILTLVIYTFTMEKIRSIAIMKLMGAANWVIIRLVLEQSLLLTLSSFIIGWLIISQTQDFFPGRFSSCLWIRGSLSGLALLGGLVASGLGIWQALKTQPALALGGIDGSHQDYRPEQDLRERPHGGAGPGRYQSGGLPGGVGSPDGPQRLRQDHPAAVRQSDSGTHCRRRRL